MRTPNPISYPTTNSSRHPYTPPPQCNQSTQTHVSFKLKRHSDHQAFRWFKRKKVMRGSSVLEGVGATDNLLNSHRKLLPPPQKTPSPVQMSGSAYGSYYTCSSSPNKVIRFTG